MKSLRRWKKDRVGGALLVLSGLAIVAQGLSYRMGTLTRMGAGYIPVVLGSLLAAVGLAVFVTAEPGDFGTAKTAPTAWRGWICIMAGLFAFVVLGTYGGLVPASFAAVFIAALGDRGNSMRDAALLAAGITIAGVIIFSYGLKIQFPMFTWG